MLNQPALFAALYSIVATASLFAVARIEARGMPEVSAKVALFGCVALVCLVGVVWCVLTNGGGIL